METAAERLKAARERDEAGIEQGEPEGPKFEAPETEPEPEPEPTEPEPEPEEEEAAETEPAGMTAEQASDLEKATAAYFKRVEKVFGADNAPPPCPACEGLGFDLTGGEAPPEFSSHDLYKACDDCGGLGHVLTGSKVQGHDLHDCPKCLGRGYLEKIPAPVAVPAEGESYGTPAWMGNVQGNAAVPPA